MPAVDNTIQDLGNSLGFIYQTKPDGTSITSNILNTVDGVDQAKRLALVDAPLASEITSRASLAFAGAAGQVDALAVNSVSLISGAITGGSVAILVGNLRDEINGTVTSPNYRAVTSDQDLVIFADEGRGSNPNGYAIAITVSGGLTETHTDMYGGQDASGLYDSAYGHRYWLNANYDTDYVAGEGTASEGTLGNALEVTKYFIQRGLQGHFDLVEGVTPLSTGKLAGITRTTAYMNFIVDTRGLAATDNLDEIETQGWVEGDIIIVRGASTTRVLTARHMQGGDGNLVLSNGASWSSGGYESILMLQYWNHSLGPRWYEISRSPDLTATVVDMRSAGIPQPVSGSDSLVLTAGGGTVNLTPGTDEEILRVTGSPNLAGSWVIQGAGTPIDGDKFIIVYEATPTVAANTVTIFGQQLTTKQAEGDYSVWVYARYHAGLGSWVTNVTIDAAAQDYEDDLAAPSSNGQILSSTTAKVRSWVDNPADGSVTVDKLASTTGIRLELYTFHHSFETGELGSYQIVLPYKCTVQEIKCEVTSAIAATDNGYCTFLNNALATFADITFVASDPFGQDRTATPTVNNAFAAGETMKATTTKATPGGTIRVDLTLNRED
jgi:hypothetical protein